ncbi:MOSC domain-containing protein [Paenibacillus odorifer]|uniref:MOSC domain-containing protein n=1 Tax=Paenibacillus odorifer TaxID=189426 RepID=A0A1R0Y1Z7_9BACL|nr:MOSC domain-containing protein [Paenibacillus odorifer]OMD41355.1 MOSC domain-containing protein [Paenibacillus odorifer]
MEIISLNVGRPVTVDYRGKPLETGIYKMPVNGAVELHTNGFVGDGQADLKHHGGPDKAVCAYPIEHYSYWEKQLGKKLEYSAFGENITTAGLLETDVCIGDVYEIGTTVLQVSQPRYPCFKISQKLGPADLPAQVLDTRYSGFYLRVLREGEISTGDAIVKKEDGAGGVSVAHVLHLMQVGLQEEAALAELAELEALSAVVRNKFRKQLGLSEG